MGEISVRTYNVASLACMAPLMSHTPSFPIIMALLLSMSYVRIIFQKIPDLVFCIRVLMK